MDLKDIGEALRAERERQGLSVEEVSERTKISRRNLEAIENGRQDDLPHLVYTRGFVKNYARLLTLDADKLGNALTQVYGGGDPYEELPGANQTTVPLTVRTSALSKIWSAAVVLFILAVIGAGGYILLGELPPKPTPGQIAQGSGSGQSEPARAESPKAIQEAKPVQEPAPRAEAPASAVPAAPVAPPKPEPGQTGARADKIAPAEAPATEPPVHAAPAAPMGSKAASFGATAKMEQGAGPAGPAGQAGTANPQAQQAPRARKEAPADRGANLVEIVASESCWLRALTDEDSRVREFNLKPGESVKLPFTRILMVKLGNAGGVKVTYNGAPFPTNAQSGQVKTISFP
jgi:cytoskeleton protein RodZ